jgi:hypothetical protein
MISDVPARGGQATPPPIFHTIPPVCVAFLPAGRRVPKELRGCIIRHAKPSVVA